MQMQRRVRTLKDEDASLRAWEAHREAEFDEWTEDTKGVMLLAVDAFLEAFDTYQREPEAAAEAVEALERLGTAIKVLGDASESERNIGAYDAALSALERRLACNNCGDHYASIVAAHTKASKLVKLAGNAVKEEIRRRRHEAAEREAARQAAEERRKTAERRCNAIAEADVARAVLAKLIPDVAAAAVGVGASHDLGDEGATGVEIVELGRAAQGERVGDGALEMAVRPLDRSVLVSHAPIVARDRHAVVGAERLVALGHVLGFVLAQVAEGRRQAVGSVLAGRAAEIVDRRPMLTPHSRVVSTC